jgi:hypothetical protein
MGRIALQNSIISTFKDFCVRRLYNYSTELPYPYPYATKWLVSLLTHTSQANAHWNVKVFYTSLSAINLSPTFDEARRIAVIL